MNPDQRLRQISVTTTPEAEEAVAEWLAVMFGQAASSYCDTESGLSTVTIFLPPKSPLPRHLRGQIAAGLKQIRGCGLKITPGKIVIARMRRMDWAESWKRHFQPIEIKLKLRRDERCESLSSLKRSGTRVTRRSETRPSGTLGNSLLIKPSWSKRKPHKDQIVIVLDPGLSFGTGHHPTTAFCLNEIVAAACDRRSRRSPSAAKKKSFLDLGTGSGILAIAAAKLDYAPVHALDSDPEAVRVARANARANSVHQKLKILYDDVTKLPLCPRQQRQEYDLVCANLISHLLITERRRIAGQLSRSGTLVLAGILKGEFAAVQRAYEALELKLVASRTEKEWRSGSFRFRG